MHITDTGREARLKPDSADLYPTLPVRRWTSAGSLAELVTAWVRLERPGAFESTRPLMEADFEFRGGILHRWTEGLAHTRDGER
jgi:hypothetical protein